MLNAEKVKFSLEEWENKFHNEDFDLWLSNLRFNACMLTANAQKIVNECSENSPDFTVISELKSDLEICLRLLDNAIEVHNRNS